ncbi:MAG: hypothetical protein KAW16_00985 [candidate division Zixibacteria bacterium]|nr:hypothetical protein [candidate division Zixibacteria bacterium]
MKKLIWILVVVFAVSLFIWAFAISQEKPKTPVPSATAEKVTKSAKADTLKKVKEHAYVGISKCKMCHNSKKWGKIYDKWAATKHATAYTTLANKESKALAKKMNIKDAQKSGKCLVCHVTGYEASAKLKGKKYSMEEGVTCEACHGPAGDYVTSHIKKDNKKQAIADGLIIPTEKLSKELCVKCHNKKSPTYQEFKYKKAIKLVEHHKPTAEELKKLEESKKEKPEGK